MSEAYERYMQTDKGKAARAKATRVYRKTEAGQAMRKKQENTATIRRLSAIAMLKLERGCEDLRCVGHPDNPEALDFDHISGQKSANISRLARGAGWTQLLDEIDKCEVVCANCHRVRTAERRPILALAL